MNKLKKFSFLLPSVLMPAFPIFSFYLRNISELSLKFIEKPLILSIGLSFVGTLFFSLIIKNKNKAALLVLLFNLIFFSYGHLSNSLNKILFIQLPNGVILGPDKILLPTITLVFVFLSFRVLKSAKNFHQTISFINVSLLVIVSYLSFSIVKKEYQKGTSLLTLSPQSPGKTQEEQKITPDIYYIILDGYARQDILKEIYDYDNSWFIESLRKMGFYVAHYARSNYLHTYLSLSSTLNMRYLDDLPKKYGIKPVSNIAARQLIYNNEVIEKLKNYGYIIINFASTWEGTNENFQADITYSSGVYFKIFNRNIALDEPTFIFLRTTLFSPFIKEVWFDGLRAQTMATLQKLPTIPSLAGKKFILSHIIPPHPPYVFTAKGDPISGTQLEFSKETINQYTDQLIFISKQILPVVQNIIQNSSSPSIIILQADHGPGSTFGKREEWQKNYSPLALKERSGILYAVYFPNKKYSQFYPSITPVNTFRILFNVFFNENLELLPDKTFYTDYEKIYDFKDVTDIVK